MSAEIKKVPRAPLDSATSDALYNQLVDRVEELSQQFADVFHAYAVGRRRPVVPEIFSGLTSSTPCLSSGSAFTDPRYYISRGVADLTLQYDETGTGSDVFGVVKDDANADFANPCVIATNLAELPKDPGGGYRHSLPDNTPVLVFAIRSRANPVNKYYVFSQQPPGGTFKVNLTQDGGSNGSKTTAASWTYTVKDLVGNTLATSASPEVGRPNGTMVAADFGLGYYDTTGTFFLLIAFEIPGTGQCPVP